MCYILIHFSFIFELLLKNLGDFCLNTGHLHDNLKSNLSLEVLLSSSTDYLPLFLADVQERGKTPIKSEIKLHFFVHIDLFLGLVFLWHGVRQDFYISSSMNPTRLFSPSWPFFRGLTAVKSSSGTNELYIWTVVGLIFFSFGISYTPTPTAVLCLDRCL